MNLPLFDKPFLQTRIKSDDVKLFPEGALGYLVGPTLAMLTNSIMANYFNTYMSNVLNINKWAGWFFTSIPVVSVFFVILGNILVGRLMDNIKTRAGKARPLVLLSVPLTVTALLILFVLSPYVNESMQEKQLTSLVLLTIGYLLLFAVAYPMYSTPHAAIVSLSTRNSKDRSLLATISNATALAAMGLVSMVLPFFLRLLFVYDMSGKGTPVYNDAGAIEYYVDEAGAAIYDGLASYQHWKFFVIILLFVTALGALIEYFFTRERVTEEGMGEGDKPKNALPVREQARICFKDSYWIIVMLFFFLYQMGGMLKNASQLYFCQAMFRDAQGNYTTANGGTIQGMLAIIGAVPTALGMLIAVPLANKIGKGRAILYGSVIAVLGGVLGLLFPDNLGLVITSFVIKALGSTPAMYLGLAMLADVLDHQEAIYGERTDGFSMTIYGAALSGCTGIATGIMNGILSALNYSASNISSGAIRAAIPWLFIGGETLGFAAIFVLFLFMRVEKFAAVDHLAISLQNGTEPPKEEIDPKILEEFNAMRKAGGRPTLSL